MTRKTNEPTYRFYHNFFSYGGQREKCEIYNPNSFAPFIMSDVENKNNNNNINNSNDVCIVILKHVFYICMNLSIVLCPTIQIPNSN